VLSTFWIASGLVALGRAEAAAASLSYGSLPAWAVSVTVFGGAFVNIALGAAILWRPWCRRAALGMATVSAAYLAGGTLFAPHLWLDPLGPLLKVFPSIVLALVVWSGVEDR
jgi:hypothetical protein